MKKRFFKQICFVIPTLFCMVSFVHAQKGRALTKLGQAALSRQVIKPVVHTTPGFSRLLGVWGYATQPSHHNSLFNSNGYNPILGYKTRFSERAFHTYNGTELDVHPMQVTPVLGRSLFPDAAYVPLGKTSLPEMTEGVYLWRLVNPSVNIQGECFLHANAKDMIRQQIQDLQSNSLNPAEAEELPNLLFLQRLLDPAFTPHTYGQLAMLTVEYPKHITLTEEGFPVPVAQAEQAREWDLYLMLSHPQMMKQFDPVSMQMPATERGYTPFVLTPEEHAAAEELLAKRQIALQVPDNPTPRQLLEIAYNQLETHLVPYNTPEAEKYHLVAYPFYNNTTLARKIKETIAHSASTVWRESTDISHLIVLNAVMGGVEFENPDGLHRVFDAFEKLCREVSASPENIAHLKHLQKALLRAPGIWVFTPRGWSRIYFTELADWEYEQLKDRITRFAELDVAAMVAPKFTGK